MGWKWPKKWGNAGNTISAWKNMKDLSQKVQEKLDKGKEFSLKNPTSLRSFSRGDDDTYITGASAIGKGLPTEVEVSSSAIKEVKYNPDTQITSVMFVGGDKFYEFQQTPDEFKEFMAADSKGRYVNYIMKIFNRIPGYN